MKKLSIFAVAIFCLLVGESAVSQTSFHGKITSVDGSRIPETVISIHPENRRDIFSGQYEDVFPEEDGSYQVQIQEPGLYRLIFRGVFHQDLRVPVMVFDQPSMRMNVLLMPMHFNDGFYFDKDNYLKWIRVVGNFNDYDYNTGERFSLNSDGSIHAFIPVNSDTIRYQVRGLAYNQGVTALPQADEFYFREDSGFEAVLYNDLPEDSLEIHYDPDHTIPFKRHLPEGADPLKIVLSGFVSLENQEDENWIQPLSLLQPYTRTFHIAGWEMSTGIPLQTQKEVQRRFAGTIYNANLGKEFEKVSRELSKENLHPQQRVILTMSYASILGWMARKTLFQQMRSEHQQLENQPEEKIPEINPDKEIINSIPEIVPPVHPAWRYNNGSVDYLLTETDDPQKFTEYFHDVVKYNPKDRAVQLIALSIIRHFGSGYSSVEEMPVYQLILERDGENDLARDAHRTFRSQITQ